MQYLTVFLIFKILELYFSLFLCKISSELLEVSLFYSHFLALNELFCFSSLHENVAIRAWRMNFTKMLILGYNYLPWNRRDVILREYHIRYPGSGIRSENLISGIRYPGSVLEISYPVSGIRDPFWKSHIRDPGFGIRFGNFHIRYPGSVRIPDPKRNPKNGS